MKEIVQFDFGSNSMQRMHVHQDPEIIYVLMGKVDITIDQEEYHLMEGDYLLINANKQHTVINAVSEVLCARFEIDYAMLTDYMHTDQILFWCNTTVDKDEAYEDLKRTMDHILTMYFEENAEEKFHLRSLYYEMLYLLVGNFRIDQSDNRMQRPEGEDGRIYEIRNYLEANYQRQISLNDLADKLYLSNAYLSKYIKKQFGIGFTEYLNNIRLFHAVNDLMYSDKKIVNIAVNCGFPTSTAFNKVFRDAYGTTPSEYRMQMKKDIIITEEEKEQEVKQRQKVKKYLKEKYISEKSLKPQKGSVLEADASRMKPLKRPWGKAFNIGNAGLLLRYDIQEHIRTIQEELKFQYGRIWNIFPLFLFDLNDAGHKRMNFNKLDRVLDFMLKTGLRPFIDLAFKPSQLISKEEVLLYEQQENILFDSKEQYEWAMQELAIHLLNRYGLEEVEQWCFELWKDPRTNIMRENGWYYDNFEVGYRILKNISQKIQVGGPGIILGYENYMYGRIFQIWKKRKIKPDFLTVYSYGYVTVAKENEFYTKKSLDRHYTMHQVEIMREGMKEAGFEVPKIYVSEWSFTLSNRNAVNDSCGMGAYVLQKCIDAEGRLDLLAYWHATDLYSEFYDTKAILNGDSGLLSKDGIQKPSFYAFSFMQRLYSNLIGRNDNAIATTNGKGSYRIACHNHKRMTYRYLVKPEDEIQIEELNECYENSKALRLQFCIQNVQPGNYLVKAYYINRKNGSVQDCWLQMGQMDNLSDKEIDYLNKICIPHVELNYVQSKGSVLKVETVLMEHEIRMLEVNYQY